MVNLHWWKVGLGETTESYNIGDYLSYVVVEWMKSRNNINSVRAAGEKIKHLYVIGSIISGGYQDATVWGSGLIRENKAYWWRNFRKLDIRAVRGLLTRQTLIENGYDCPDVYGDPAILMPLIYQPSNINKISRYVVVSHYSQYKGGENEITTQTKDYKRFIDSLVTAELVVSDSLHGIILAESYGVPAIWLCSDLDTFKYSDYYKSTGRDHVQAAGSIEEALRMTPPPLPDLDTLREGLIRAFPIDLYQSSNYK